MSTSRSIEASGPGGGLKSVSRQRLIAARDVNLKHLAHCPFELDNGFDYTPILAWLKMANCFEIYVEYRP